MEGYSKEELSLIIEELDLSSAIISDNMRSMVFKNKPIFDQFQQKYPGLWKTCKEFVYWVHYYRDSDFIDRLFCKCGSRVRFDQDRFKYRTYCSSKCTRIYSEEKIKQTNLERYGVEWTGSVPEFKEKREKTNLERYGFKTPIACKEVQEKSKQTCLERYGCENPMQSEEVQNKAKESNRRLYGVDCALKNEGVRKRIAQTCLKRYGCENAVSSSEVRSKIKKTFNDKYGFDSCLNDPEVRSKIKSTCSRKYGGASPMSSVEVRSKAKKTNIDRYGHASPTNNSDVKSKMKNTNLERYGCENPMQSEEIKAKFNSTIRDKYGVQHQSQMHISKETLEILSSKEKLKDYIDSQSIKTCSFLASDLNFCLTGFRKYLHKYDLWNSVDHCISSYEMEIQNLFPNTFTKTRSAISPYEIDLYSEEHKFGIEFNGDYWHSEKNTADPFYHQKKSLLAEDKGIFLYHIFEHEWNDSRIKPIIISQIKNILGINERKIFARKCELKEVSSKEARKFLEENHIQGHSSASVRLGLYYNSELVSLMTFGKPRFDKNYQWELIRFCNKKDTSVVGGASKLFSKFISSYDPSSILSYSHIDKGTGKFYGILGFKFGKITDPDYIWYYNNGIVLSRYQCQKHKLLDQGFEGNSEKEIMESRGFSRIFGCGNKIWSLVRCQS